MKLCFVRHAQGQRVMHPPQSLEMSDPALTTVGIGQARKLKKSLPVLSSDVIVL